MKSLSFIIITALLCATNSFDMKYSLQKHEWNEFIPKLIADDNIDKHKRISYFSGERDKTSLKSTELAGRVTIKDSYILAAYFKMDIITSSCLFSLERKGVQKLALCLEPAGENAVTTYLVSAKIPDGKLSFEHKILKNEWTDLVLSVNKTGVTLLINCNVVEEKRFNTDISNLQRLTDDMELDVATGHKIEIIIEKLDLYAPVDVTTLMTLCPDLHSSQFRGEHGEKGDKGDRGLKGDTGNKGEVGEHGIGIIGQKGEQGQSGLQGEKGERGWVGPIGPSGLTGERGGPGEKGERGEPGASCLATNVPPAAAGELDALKSILSDIKSIFSGYILERTEQLKYFTELNTKCNDRLTAAELNIEALRNAMLTEANM